MTSDRFLALRNSALKVVGFILELELFWSLVVQVLKTLFQRLFLMESVRNEKHT